MKFAHAHEELSLIYEQVYKEMKYLQVWKEMKYLQISYVYQIYIVPKRKGCVQSK